MCSGLNPRPSRSSNSPGRSKARQGAVGFGADGGHALQERPGEVAGGGDDAGAADVGVVGGVQSQAAHAFAAGHHDAVAVGVDEGIGVGGVAGRADLQPGDIDAALAEIGQDHLAGVVGADVADHADAQAEAGGGGGDVAFDAAGPGAAVEDGHPGVALGQDGDAVDVVDGQAADGDEVEIAYRGGHC